MKKYISLSKYPGKNGQRYYTQFFKNYKINATYEPLGTDNLKESINTALTENVYGISISMPYKQEVIQLLDVVDKLVERYDSCNTVVNRNGKLYGYNTDLMGVIHVSNFIPMNCNVSILGNGCMASMFKQYLGNANIVTNYSPSLGNWDLRNQSTDVIINCTPYGTIDSSSPYEFIPKDTKTVIDLAINSGVLANQAKENGITYISGKDFYKQQFIKQFEIYTEIQINEHDFNKISFRC